MSLIKAWSFIARLFKFCAHKAGAQKPSSPGEKCKRSCTPISHEIKTWLIWWRLILFLHNSSVQQLAVCSRLGVSVVCAADASKCHHMLGCSTSSTVSPSAPVSFSYIHAAILTDAQVVCVYVPSAADSETLRLCSSTNLTLLPSPPVSLPRFPVWATASSLRPVSGQSTSPQLVRRFSRSRWSSRWTSPTPRAPAPQRRTAYILSPSPCSQVNHIHHNT